jgi:hypothetical protein
MKSKMLEIHHSLARTLVKKAIASVNYDFLGNAFPPYHLGQLLAIDDPIDFGLLVKALRHERDSLILLGALTQKHELYEKLYKAIILWTLDTRNVDLLQTLVSEPSFDQVFSATASMKEWLDILAIESRKRGTKVMNNLLALEDKKFPAETKTAFIMSGLNSALLARHVPLVLRYYKLVANSLSLKDLELLYERASLTGSRQLMDLFAKDLLSARIKNNIQELPVGDGIVQDNLEIHQALLRLPELGSKYSHDILHDSGRQPVAHERDLAEIQAESIHIGIQEVGLHNYLERHTLESTNNAVLLEVYLRLSSQSDKLYIFNYPFNYPVLREKILAGFFDRLHQDGNLHRYVAERLLTLYYSGTLPEDTLEIEFLRYLRVLWPKFPQRHPFPQRFLDVTQLKINSQMAIMYGKDVVLESETAAKLKSSLLEHLVEHHENVFLDLMESQVHSPNVDFKAFRQSKIYLADIDLFPVPSHNSYFYRRPESRTT